MSIFTSEKAWKFLIKIQLTKSDTKRTRIKVSPLMPIGVKWPIFTQRGKIRTGKNIKSLFFLQGF
jgi:hypothetical protein